MTDALHVESLAYTVDGATLLHDVSFTIPAGQYASIIGPNGAGKSTLLKCLARIHTKWRGKISLEGNDLRAYRQRDLARRLAYVPQADGRYLPFTVREFVMMGRYAHWSPFSTVRPDDTAAVESALGETGLQHLADRPVATLSGGERQNVAIAAALAQEASILLLDEPTTFLDYRHQVDVGMLLERLHRERAMTIVAVTHDVNAHVFHSDAVLALKSGTTAYFGPPEGLNGGGVLESVYDTEFRYVRNEGMDTPLVTPERPQS